MCLCGQPVPFTGQREELRPAESRRGGRIHAPDGRKTNVIVLISASDDGSSSLRFVPPPPARLTFPHPDVLCSGCWRSPSTSSRGPQTVSPATSCTPRSRRRAVAAELRRHRGWASVPLRLLFLYVPPFGVSVGYPGEPLLPLG